MTRRFPKQYVRRFQMEEISCLSVPPVTIPHALAVADLPDHHNDPFDRLLIAQAKVEGFTLVTGDEQIKKYDVSIMEA